MLSMEKKYRLAKFLSGNNGRALIILNNQRRQPEIISLLKQRLQGCNSDAEIILFKPYPSALLEGLNKKARYCDEFLTKEEGREIDSFVYNDLAANWFNFKFAPDRYLTEYDGHLFAKFIGLEFCMHSLEVAKHTAIAQNLMASFIPERVVIIEDSPFIQDIIKPFRSRYNFSALNINLQSSAECMRPEKIIRKAKSYFMDLAILIVEFFALRNTLRRARSGKKIIIDSRLYGRFSGPEISGSFLLYPAGKGLRARLGILRSGLPYLPFYAPSHFRPFAKRRFRRDWKKIKDAPEFRRRFSFRGVELWGLFEKYLEGVFCVAFPRIMANITILKKLASTGNIRLLVMHNDLKELEGSLIGAAQKLKITSLVIQHGIVAEFYTPARVYCDTMACWGRAFIDEYKKFPQMTSRLIVTGNPRYDELCRRNNAQNNALLRRNTRQWLGLAEDKKIVSFLTQPRTNTVALGRVNETELLLETVISAVKQHAGLQLVIKAHPSDDINIYRNYLPHFLKGAENNIIILKNHNAFDVLEISDAVIIVDSSSGLEALILEKPLIKLNLTKFASLVPYVERGCAIGVDRPEGLAAALNDCLYNTEVRERLSQRRQSFISDYAYRIDGLAARRTEELMRAILEKGMRDE